MYAAHKKAVAKMDITALWEAWVLELKCTDDDAQVMKRTGEKLHGRTRDSRNSMFRALRMRAAQIDPENDLGLNY
jgi:hypothetical protein